MKKIFGFIILLGFVIMLGAAGSGDVYGMSFSKVVLLELLGMFVVLAGTSGFMHYRRYVKRVMRKRAVYGAKLKRRIEHSSKAIVARKEMC